MSILRTRRHGGCYAVCWCLCRLLVDRGTYNLCMDWSMVHQEASTQLVEMGGMMYGIEICFPVEPYLI